MSLYHPSFYVCNIALKIMLLTLRVRSGEYWGEERDKWGPQDAGGQELVQEAIVDGATDRATFQDVPPEWTVRGLLSQLQQVVQNHLTNEIMPREAVKVIDTEMQLALCQLGQGYRELKSLIEDRVQRLPVHLEGDRQDVHWPCS